MQLNSCFILFETFGSGSVLHFSKFPYTFWGDCTPLQNLRFGKKMYSSFC